MFQKKGKMIAPNARVTRVEHGGRAPTSHSLLPALIVVPDPLEDKPELTLNLNRRRWSRSAVHEFLKNIFTFR